MRVSLFLGLICVLGCSGNDAGTADASTENVGQADGMNDTPTDLGGSGGGSDAGADAADGVGGGGGMGGGGGGGGGGAGGGSSGADGGDGAGEGPKEICGKVTTIKNCRDTIVCAEMCVMERSAAQMCVDPLADAGEKAKANAYWDCAYAACLGKPICKTMTSECGACVCAELCKPAGKCAKEATDCVGSGDLNMLNPECGYWGC